MKKLDVKNLDFQKHSKIILGIAAALIIILDFSLIVKPQIRWSKNLNSKIKQLKTEIEQTDKDIALIARIKERDEASKKDLVDIEKRVPREEEITMILEDISSAANSTMVKILQMKPLKERKEIMLETTTGKYYRIPISIEVQGSYHLFGKFLNTLENSEIFMSVNDLEILPSAKDYKRHNINLVINTFIFKK